MLRSWFIHALGLGLLLMPAAEVFADRKLDELAGRLEKVERTLNNRGLVDLLQQVEVLQRELQRLRGEIENQSYLLEQMRATQRDSYVDLDRRLRRLEVSSPVIAGAPVPEGMAVEPPLPMLDPAAGSEIAGMPAPDSALQVEVQSAAPGAMPGATVPGTEAVPGVAPGTAVAAEVPPGAEMPAPGAVPATAVPSSAAVAVVAPPSLAIAPPGPTVDDEASETSYRDAFGLLKAGQYDESIAAFNAFLAQYPSSQYADNAQYWLGEAHYVMRQFDRAAVEYQKLITNYPDSKKQSHAMLKIGYSYHELGHTDQARAVLEDLRTRYPGTAAARLAEERIQRIRAERPAP